MFSEDDNRRATRVEPLGFEEEPDVTQVRPSIHRDNSSEQRLPLLVPAVVIFSAILLTAPKGAVLETAVSLLNSTKRMWSEQKPSQGGNSVGQGGVNINANNANVQNIQIISNGGQVNVPQMKK